ncbi:unnamed protein product [Acanthoscelides obtectus]|uniref:Multidrug resistance-associated protein 4-like n=1 Tax=Acanthoscelides obtectus TaxID=200917 RepID=A0A9P0PHM7_ACAOB|nr:unnamed protein product [Acanthoscelides obtectus]CAK1625166.1 Multidrug resistance-associated protein 4 [Acanthoscelides obtectus]
MDSTKKHVNPSPEEKATFLSKIFYCWFMPFLKYGYKHDLEIKDIYNTTKSDLSAALGDQLEKNWLKEVQRAAKHKDRPRKPSLSRAIFKTFYKTYLVYGLFLLFQCLVIKMFQPIVLALYIGYYDKGTNALGPEIGWLLAVGVVTMSFVNMIIMHYTNLGCVRIGMRVRIACCSLIYRKLLKLSQGSLGQTAAGQLVNLLSNDVQRFDMASTYLHYLWIMPLQSIIAFYVMYRSVQMAAVAGMAAIALQAIPLQGYLSKLQGIYRSKIALRTDYRVKLMSEITSGIQVIKMYAWEKPFEKIVELARKYEIDYITKTSYVRGVTVASYVFMERLTLYLTLVAYVIWSGKPLTGDVVFSVAQLYNTVQLYMSIFFPLAMSTYAEARVSVKRIEDFLRLSETKSKGSGARISKGDPGEIKLTKVSATWISNAIAPTLIDINFHIKPGTLCCVVGSVGAGKSSLLQLLIGELQGSGRVNVSGRIAYANQEPWLFVSSVRNNILFGRQYLKNRYHDVVDCCALETDFEQLPFGDKTMVGERGVSLSGGQRARINLARAVYSEADIYLFDDPLSAVDPHVAKHLFGKCISGYLKGKTRVLVTHQVQFLREADAIIVINNGKIEKTGTFAELSEQELNCLKQEEHEQKQEQEKGPKIEFRERLKSIASINSSVHNEEEPQETDELIEKGAISTSTYLDYCKAGASWIVLILLVLLLIVAQIVSNASDLWLTYWTNMEEDAFFHSRLLNTTGNNTDLYLNTTNNAYDSLNGSTLIAVAVNYTDPEPWLDDRSYYVNIYTLFIFGAVILTSLRSIFYFKICMTASKVLHNQMFSCILQAPMRFFDTNPSGRILNRFSKDMGALDELLPKAALDAIQVFLVMFGILIMVFIVTPLMVIPAIILGLIFYWFRSVYIGSAQDIKRLEGGTRAPVFSYISSTLYGISTIRSSNAEEMVKREFDGLQDRHTSTWFLFLTSSEAFGFYLDVISTIFLSLVTFQFLIFEDENTLSGNVGLVISQCLILTGMLQFGVRQTAEVASNMVSVERVLQYTTLDKEGPFETLPANKPPLGWPDKGHIQFEKVYLRYAAELAPVLKNLTIEVMPGEKVGIVGRTGAGKSTLISSLFRLAPIEGAIVIDGIDTSKIGLTELRSSISIIPQEPVLFSASVRYNLDPFEKHGDDVLWKALEDVELKIAIEDLNQEVSEGGSNFSAGQRQLICLARAIVRNNKILVMDEATANVDPQSSMTGR